MGLPWVRLDTSIVVHDKMLDLLADPSPKRHQAALSYLLALAWSGGVGTDGRIRNSALASVHGTPATARLLIKYGFWDEAPGGYQIHNWELRQQNSAVADAAKAKQKAGGAKGACIRRHGPNCGCWSTQEVNLEG